MVLQHQQRLFQRIRRFRHLGDSRRAMDAAQGVARAHHPIGGSGRGIELERGELVAQGGHVLLPFLAQDAMQAG